MERYQFLANVFLAGTIEVETGLSIGGSSEGYEIGGMDNPVIRYMEGDDEFPYVPGSSIKGKMRSLMEWARPGKLEDDGSPHTCNDEDCTICRIFGRPAESDVKEGPGRLVVRDAFPDEETKEQMLKIEREKGLPKTEWKTENSLNRLTSEAMPRPMERVTKGSKFNLRMVYSVYEIDGDGGEADISNLAELIEGMQMLEDSFLGGSGSRGYGRISIDLLEDLPIRTLDEYGSKMEEVSVDGPLLGVKEVDGEGLKEKVRSDIESSVSRK